MPIYEYRCNKCDSQFEDMRPMSERDDKAECPECGSDDTRRVMSSFAVGQSSTMDASKYPGPPETAGSCPTGTCSLS